jgi:CII-binding regulator of phage lambda lysogenization HflD
MMKQTEILKALRDTLAGRRIDIHGGEEIDLKQACELLLEYMEKESKLNRLRLRYALACADMQSASGKAYRDLLVDRKDILAEMEELE